MDKPLRCGECAKELGSERIFAKTAHGDRYCEPCWKVINADEIEAEAKCDRWHAGYFAKERPTDPDELDGWLHRIESSRVQVVPVVRPEGYYHAPLGTFE